MTTPTSERQVPLAIIGIGCMFPGAANLREFWTNIRTGADSITAIPPTHWNVDDYFDSDPKSPDRTYARRGGFLSPIDFDPLEFGIAPNDLEAIDTAQLLSLVAAKRALEDAGYGKDRPFDRSRVSVILGVTGTLELVIPLGARLGHPHWRRALKDAGVDDKTAEDVIDRISDAYVPWQENSFPGLLGNVVAGRIANRLDLGGTNCVVDAACASSLSGLHLAALELATGRSDMVLTGGVDTFNDIFMYMCFSKTPALSPTGDARPFAENADGTILGEGVGILAIKRLADAERDGDRIYAVIRGVGSSSDGKGNAVYAPKADGQVRAVRTAHQIAGVEPETIELIEAHGTGTKVGDATEASGLATVFQTRHVSAQNTKSCAVGSVKSQIGHTKAAAGVAGIIKAAMALHHRVLPPTIKVDRPNGVFNDDNCPLYVNTEARPWLGGFEHPRRAGVSSFGFGGSNFHCVLEEHAGSKTADWSGNTQILCFSGKDLGQLFTRIREWKTPADWTVLRASAAALRRDFRAADECRLLVVVERGKTEVAKAIANAVSMLERYPERKFWSLPEGVYFGRGAKAGRLAMLFPGQGSQYVGMFRGLACQFPEMQSALQEADQVFAEVEPSSKRRLSDYIYPVPVFDEQAAGQHEDRLRSTDVAQPAIGAVSIGALRVLAGFGVHPEAVAGHSYGELTALCAARRYESKVLFSLSRLRGRLMAEGDGNRGAMLAVSAAVDAVERTIVEESLNLVLANRNAPRQIVLSGATAEIERAESLFAVRSIRSRRLAVSAAFHSPLVAEAKGRFRPALDTVPFAPTEVPVFSNTTAAEYPASADAARDLLASQLAEPVNFVGEVESMYEAGVRTFVEVGPGTTLTGLVDAILSDREHTAIALNASRGRRADEVDLAQCLAHLSALGYEVQLAAWDPMIAEPVSKRAGMTVPICGANYIKPRVKRPPVDSRSGAAAVHQGSTSVDKPVTPLASAPPTPVPVARPTSLPPAVVVKSPITDPPPMPRISPVLESPLPAARSGVFDLAQQNFVALQRMQEQTARLHQQFLQGQEAALRTFERLFQAQQSFATTASALARPSAQVEVDANGADVPAPIAAPQPVSRKPASAPEPDTASSIDKIAPAVVDHPATGTSAATPTADNRTAMALLEIVAEKTGYPVEMLDLSMGLDQELGIDSIKRVEILSAVQERLPNAPGVKPEQLGSFHSLADIAAFLGASVAATEPVAQQATTDKRGASIPDAHVGEVLLSVVAEKTGYPAEMLDLSMGLDQDLGIDSIKRVEILSALQECLPGAPTVKPEQLGSFHTLRDIAEFLAANTPATSAGIQAALPEASNSVQTVLLEVVADKTGYPVEMLEPGMSLDQDLGIDSIKRVEIFSAVQERLPAMPIVRPEDLGRFHTLQQVIDFLSGSQPSGKSSLPVTPAEPDLRDRNDSSEAFATVAPSVRTLLRRSIMAARPLESQTRPRLDLPAGSKVLIAGDHLALCEAVAERLRWFGVQPILVSLNGSESLPVPSGLRGLVVVAPESGATDADLAGAFSRLQSAAPGLLEGESFFATVSRLDGRFGLSNAPADPLSGGLAGLAKTARHEWPSVSCKAIDLASDWDSPMETASAIVEELLTVGPVEVGLAASGACTIELLDDASSEPTGLTAFEPGALVVVSGGARGVTAEVAFELARRWKPTLLLLGRSPFPGAEEDWLAGLTGESDIKRALAARADGKAAPKTIESRYRQIIASREIARNLERISQYTTVLYRAVDVRDEHTLRHAIDEARAQFGPVRGLVHGAGVIADRLIIDKTREQFDEVYATKVTGLRNLLAACGHDPLKSVALFSSFTGRFGRTGQVDYAVANEVLNKLARQLQRERAECRVVSFNWGPWAGGMVDAGLQKVFEKEGVGLIPLDAGAALLADELGARQTDVEIVVLADDADSRADAGAALRVDVSVEQFPILADHVIGGQAVVPMALMVEWLAHAALHQHPGLEFVGLTDFRVYKGIRVAGDECYSIATIVENPIQDTLTTSVGVKLMGEASGRPVLHAGGKVLLAAKRAGGPARESGLLKGPAYPLGVRDAYADLLFHGPALQVIEQLGSCSPQGAEAYVRSNNRPGEWVLQPLRGSWLANPAALDAAFQLMILWCIENEQAPSLPCYVARYEQYERSFPTHVRVVATVTRRSHAAAVADVDFVGDAGQLIARITGYECVIDDSLRAAFHQRQLTLAHAR